LSFFVSQGFTIFFITSLLVTATLLIFRLDSEVLRALLPLYDGTCFPSINGTSVFHCGSVFDVSQETAALRSQ